MKIIFAGTPDFATTSLSSLIHADHEICAVYTQPDRPAGRGRKLQPSPVKILAEANQLTVFQPESLKNEVAIKQLKVFDADLMIVAAYGLILPPEVLATPRLGCINIHASLLPRWRGAAPIQRAILAGDKMTGITIMQMAKGLDTGDMLFKITTPIHPNETAVMLHDRLAELGGKALLEILPNIENGTTTATPQKDEQATYARKLDKKEALIDWSEPASKIERKIRAFNSWPVAQTVLNKKPLRIWKAAVIKEASNKPCGTLILTGDGQLDVATGSGQLRLLEVQLPGKKRMPTTAFINGRNLQGVQLGQA